MGMLPGGFVFMVSEDLDLAADWLLGVEMWLLPSSWQCSSFLTANVNVNHRSRRGLIAVITATATVIVVLVIAVGDCSYCCWAGGEENIVPGRRIFQETIIFYFENFF
jgi:hypothetical protein